MKSKVFCVDITSNKDVIFTRETRNNPTLTVTGHHIQSNATITRLNDLMTKYECRLRYYHDRIEIAIYNHLKG